MFEEIRRHQYVSDDLSPENLYQCVMTSRSGKVLATITKFISPFTFMCMSFYIILGPCLVSLLLRPTTRLL